MAKRAAAILAAQQKKELEAADTKEEFVFLRVKHDLATEDLLRSMQASIIPSNLVRTKKSDEEKKEHKKKYLAGYKERPAVKARLAAEERVQKDKARRKAYAQDPINKLRRLIVRKCHRAYLNSLKSNDWYQKARIGYLGEAWNLFKDRAKEEGLDISHLTEADMDNVQDEEEKPTTPPTVPNTPPASPLPDQCPDV